MDHLEKSMLCPYICFYSPDKSTCTVGKKGLQSLISASDQRGDGLKDQFDTILDHMQQDGSYTLQLPKVCNRYYVEQK